MTDESKNNRPLLRVKLRIGGIVQGVGFRPFLHRLVSEYGFGGWVRNDPQGVELELEGEEAALRSLAARIPIEAPALADVQYVRWEEQEGLVHFTAFEIVESGQTADRKALISPDVGLCEDCRREMLTPGERRYRYPFLNCTNCGPRFTIIKDIPYDRVNTAMAAFPMCPDCAGEYRDIRDRRYHAEPTCCPHCGPQLFYVDAQGRRWEREAALEQARRRLKAGDIVCVKGLGGMHLACLPGQAARLRERKKRDARPFALMCRDVEAAGALCEVTAEEKRALESYRRPIVLLKKRRAHDWPELSENRYLGVMLPYTPLHTLLLGEDIPVLIMTSANRSELPIVYQNEEALRALRDVADGFLLHDRHIVTRCDDSLLWVHRGQDYLLRRSRGYVPYPVYTQRLTMPGLACGAEQKASFALGRAGQVFCSQHMGDLKNFETFEHYREQIGHFQRLFDIQPAFVACDLHPDYLSTRHAQELAARWQVPCIPVQHHHAHMAACMADNELSGPVIGIVWDGVGYGTDGKSWGGEFLLGDYRSAERAGYLRPLPLPGGDRAVEEIWRLGYALSRDASLYPGFDTAGVEAMLERDFHCPPAHGMSRLFDAVSSLLGLCQRASYEGQGAVLLEAAAAEDGTEHYPVSITEGNVFDWGPMVERLLRDKKAGVKTSILASRFMNTLVEMAVEITRRIGAQSGVRDVVLSGGTFQNRYLLERLPERLELSGFTVHLHRRVSCNDEGLALGQLLVAQAALKK